MASKYLLNEGIDPFFAAMVGAGMAIAAKKIYDSHKKKKLLEKLGVKNDSYYDETTRDNIHYAGTDIVPNMIVKDKR